MDTMETKELRGLTIKNLWGFISTTAIIILAVWRIMAGYAGKIEESVQVLNTRVLNLEADKNGEAKYNDLKFKTIDINLQTQQVQINNLQNQVNSNTKSIEHGN